MTLQLTQPANDTLLGMIANGARVDENDVGTVGDIHRQIASGSELAEHELGVADVHLAAVGFDVDGGLGHSSDASGER